MKNTAKKLAFPPLPQAEKTFLSCGETKIFVSAAGDIHLETAKAQLIITAAGEIKISAIAIKQEAKKDIELSTQRHLKINAPI